MQSEQQGNTWDFYLQKLSKPLCPHIDIKLLIGQHGELSTQNN